MGLLRIKLYLFTDVYVAAECADTPRKKKTAEQGQQSKGSRSSRAGAAKLGQQSRGGSRAGAAEQVQQSKRSRAGAA